MFLNCLMSTKNLTGCQVILNLLMKRKKILEKKKKIKIKEIKSSKKIKEVSPIEIKNELKEELEETSPTEFKNILKTIDSSPSLERVVNTGGREEFVNEIIPQQDTTRDEKEDEKKLDYESIGSGEGGYMDNQQDNREKGFHYTSTSDTQETGFQDDEERVETRKRISRGDMGNQEVRTGRVFGLEDTKETRETKRHLSRGDYK